MIFFIHILIEHFKIDKNRIIYIIQNQLWKEEKKEKKLF